MSDSSSILDQWSQPPALYRSAPFWSWNSRLEPERLTKAIESMHAAGMGGFFMHSRYGLKTPYLSDRWFECISACVEKARQLGMKAYLYDEDRWPSGTAGGAVTREHPEYGVHLVKLSFAAEAGEGVQRLGVFHLVRDAEGRMESYGPADPTASPNETTGTVAFDVIRQAPSGWHNDGAYLDEMNPDAVAEFIRLTHQAYADRYGQDFGALIPAIFTDEPNVVCEFWSDRPDTWSLPWTPEMPRQFVQRCGYDLRDHLPELVFDLAGSGFSKVRHDYWQCVSELFAEAFSRQIGQWCDRHHLASTGHMLAEQTLRSQTERVGAAMCHYQHMQWPGIDILTDSARELITAKQCTSVAAQLGKERTLSELYGCTGWDWPMEGHKFVGDWHVAAGVNFRCPHLTHYGLGGGAKRDYPASIFEHSPWWPHYKIVEDYFARLHLFATAGKPVRDVLVIHPVASAWGAILPGRRDDDPVGHLDEQLKQLVYRLSGEHYDWDFADESILAEHGRASRGHLQVGQMEYHAAIVPVCMTLRSTTVQLLDAFQQSGGTVLVVGEGPGRIDAKPVEQKPLAGARRVSTDPGECIDALDQAIGRRVRVLDGDGEARYTWTMFRQLPEGYALFCQSHDRKQGHDVTIQLAGKDPVVRWDLQSGIRTVLPSRSENGGVAVDVHLHPTGSVLLTVGWDLSEARQAPTEPTILDSCQLAGPLPIELSEPNSFPLDRCRYRIGQGEWSEPMVTLKADAGIREHFGLTSRAARGHQPWYLYGTGVIDTKPRGPVQIRWDFRVTDVPAACKLAIENPQDYQVAVNGKPVGKVDGWWIDRDIATIDIAGLLQSGQNVVEWSMDYRPDMELENMFLVGDFGVRRIDPSQPRRAENYTLAAPPESLELGSWLGQGLDFYGGAVRYHLRLTRPEGNHRLVLALPGIECTMAVIHVDGRSFPLPWEPFETDITEAMAPGEQDVVVEVIGGRKNILGPLHTPWEAWTGPAQFDPANAKWTDEYLLNDHGLTEGPVVEIRQG